jgi:hypothetical protein
MQRSNPLQTACFWRTLMPCSGNTWEGSPQYRKQNGQEAVLYTGDHLELDWKRGLINKEIKVDGFK